MLIVTRRKSESIIIYDDITVTVLSIDGNQVKVGVDAPRDVPVNRKEIQDRIDKGKTQGNS